MSTHDTPIERPEEAPDAILGTLNPEQREAASHGDSPLLIVAGAGTGKTATLVHRVAWLISQGADPSRILLLTFTRRAAAEMLRRVDTAMRNAEEHAAAQHGQVASRIWGGTFHAIATRLLRMHGPTIGLPADFTILDRSDSEDLMNVVRTDLALAKSNRRFPKKGTCMSIYSRCVNAREKLTHVLKHRFPWCEDDADGLKQLFGAYTDKKESTATLDYDDLLLYWHALLQDEAAAEAIRSRFDHILVDEYQDTNVLQAGILQGLSPDGKGLTVVGDDAQSIYSFRAATVRNILDFPAQYPDAEIVRLERNYRSTQPILEMANRVISQSPERFTKNLWTTNTSGERPRLVACEDDEDQVQFVVRNILEHRERGVALKSQAVLFRASHHSMLLEAELSRANIPFHKYGGLKFVEAAHVKDLMAFLRLAENPRDMVAGTRILPLLPGIGPKTAMKLMDELASTNDIAAALQSWREWRAPPAAKEQWAQFVDLTEWLIKGKATPAEQLHRVRAFYEPICEEKYDASRARLRDLEQLEEIASRYRSRQQLLTELALDPPTATEDFAGPPVLDDDFLILSTIHSAKGLEWDCVYVIHASDGNIPSDMATGSPEEIAEELRLFYVALTRAKSHLAVCSPLRYYYAHRSDRHGYALVTRFINKDVRETIDCIATDAPLTGEADILPTEKKTPQIKSADVRKRTKDLWD